MSKKPNLFKGLLNLIHGTSGEGAELDSPASSASTSAPQKRDQSKNVNTVNTVIDNSKALEKLTAQLQKEDKAQINAGVKAFSNDEYDEAIEHYKKAIVINPGDGSIYNNIGNVYLRGKEDAETALQYYVEATKIEPSFNYGWMNLALCQKALGDLSGAKTTIAQGLNALKHDDALYQILIQLQSELN